MVEGLEIADRGGETSNSAWARADRSPEPKHGSDEKKKKKKKKRGVFLARGLGRRRLKFAGWCGVPSAGALVAPSSPVPAGAVVVLVKHRGICSSEGSPVRRWRLNTAPLPV